MFLSIMNIVFGLMKSINLIRVSSHVIYLETRVRGRVRLEGFKKICLTDNGVQAN